MAHIEVTFQIPIQSFPLIVTPVIVTKHLFEFKNDFYHTEIIGYCDDRLLWHF